MLLSSNGQNLECNYSEVFLDRCIRHLVSSNPVALPIDCSLKVIPRTAEKITWWNPANSHNHEQWATLSTILTHQKHFRHLSEQFREISELKGLEWASQLKSAPDLLGELVESNSVSFSKRMLGPRWCILHLLTTCVTATVLLPSHSEQRGYRGHVPWSQGLRGRLTKDDTFMFLKTAFLWQTKEMPDKGRLSDFCWVSVLWKALFRNCGFLFMRWFSWQQEWMVPEWLMNCWAGMGKGHLGRDISYLSAECCRVIQPGVACRGNSGLMQEEVGVGLQS